MTIPTNGRRTALAVLVAAGLALPARAGDKIPVTTSSEEAKQLYLKGRDLVEKLRGADARPLFEQAAAKDPSFALAQVGLANTAPTPKDFFAALERAVALAPKASPSEQLMICSLDAGAKGDVARQKDCLTKLLAAHPNDERAHNLMGAYHFGRQEWEPGVVEYVKATSINPQFSQPYNQMGYAYRFLGKYPEAETAFKKYIELIPGDPNPYDSYAELLMKMGRFEDSIRNYEKALSIDKNFAASYIGIGNNRMFMGQPDEARKALAGLAAVARNDGERRQALFWTAMSRVHQGATDEAVAQVKKMAAIATAKGDLVALSGDQNLMGDILLEAGRADEAAALYREQVASIDRADVPAEVKATTHRQNLFDEARLALARQDLAAAKAKAAQYAAAVAAKKIPFEMRQQHELAGRIALEEKQHAAAIAELQQANQQDPRVLYLLALAYQGQGNAQKAQEAGRTAADWNALSPNYGYVRGKAKAMLVK